MKKIITAVITFALLIGVSVASAHFDKSLAFGMSGSEVKELQEFLSTQNCFNHEATGYFGFITLKAVKCFQADNEIITTGYFGILSRTAANKIADELLTDSNTAQIQETGTLAPVQQAPTSTPAQVIIIQQPAPQPIQPQAAAVAPAPVTPTFTTGSPHCYEGEVNESIPVTITGPWKSGSITLSSDAGYKGAQTFSPSITEGNMLNHNLNGVYEFWNKDAATYNYTVTLDNTTITGSFIIKACPLQ